MPTPHDEFTELILALAASESLRAHLSAPCCEMSMEMVVRSLGLRFRFVVAPIDSAPLPIETTKPVLVPIPVPVVVPVVVPIVKLTPLQERIVAVLRGHGPRKAAWIASKLRRTCGGSFRNLLSDMVRYGVLLKPEDGGYEVP